MPIPFRLVPLVLALALPLAACASHGSPATAESQLRFGVNMAQKGLWSEAIFRFLQAQRLEGGQNPRVLNNLAVASEALGKFDQALTYYKQALVLAPGNSDLKANYDRFVSFYESFRARGEEGKGPKTGPASDPNAAANAGEPASPPRPQSPPPPVPTGVEPPDQPPLLPPGVEPPAEPQPTPPGAPLSYGDHHHA
ncbi:MAG TPA: tetratricopeptide repeat protein [Thermoanaerobaculia bacterium]|jgi:tetratricopeptide (TPR) repeat protein|nr:tetratricopeptide repeat protein [Thermoanaerobaculia bacterium]